MLYAPGAVAAAQRPIVNIVAPSSFVAGSLITLDAGGSSAACKRSITNYSWTLVSTNGAAPPVPTTGNQSTLQLNAPASGSYTLRMTVTDNEGSTDSGDIVIQSTSIDNRTPAITTAPACPATINVVEPPNPQTLSVAPPATPKSGGGGGGGSLTWYWLAAMLSMSLQRKKQ
jgi:hypothetical protein